MSKTAKKPAAAKKAPAKKTTTKKTATKKAASKKTAAKATEKGNMKMAAEKAANTAKKNAEAATERAKEIFGDVNERSKEAFAKGGEMLREFGEFQKGNVEAMIESGKIAANGMQEIGKENVSYARENWEATTAALKEFQGVKSPTDFFKLQGEHARKGFDTYMSQASKNAEAVVKLASDVFQPMSDRMSVAAERIKKAA